MPKQAPLRRPPDESSRDNLANAFSPAAAPGAVGVAMSLIPKKGTVYVVDDDEAVRDSLQWLLEGKDYRVKCFDSAESFCHASIREKSLA